MRSGMRLGELQKLDWRDVNLNQNILFLTVTKTVDLTTGHTDVSLWYILKGSSSVEYTFDIEEFIEVRWFLADEIPYNQTDPHMKKFIEN